MKYDFEDEFAGSLNINSFIIDNVKYKLRISWGFEGDDACLISLDTNKLPLETIRYIGGVPWKAKGQVREYTPFVALLLGYGAKTVYRTIWEQVHTPRISGEAFKKFVLKSVLSKL